MSKLSNEERERLAASLRAELSRGDCLFVVRIGATDSSYKIRLYAIHGDLPVWLTGQAARLLGFRRSGNDMIVPKPGYSVTQYIAEALGQALYGDHRALLYSEL